MGSNQIIFNIFIIDIQRLSMLKSKVFVCKELIVCFLAVFVVIQTVFFFFLGYT